MVVLAVSLEELLTRLRAAAKLAERLHRGNLEQFAEEALRLLERGDVRDAAEKAWAAYKSLLGLILATRGLSLIEERVRKAWEQRSPASAEKELEWWAQTGLLVPSARPKLEQIARLAAEAVGDREIYERLVEAVVLHLWFYHGPDIVPLSEEAVKERIVDLVDWARKRAKQYGLL